MCVRQLRQQNPLRPCQPPDFALWFPTRSDEPNFEHQCETIQSTTTLSPAEELNETNGAAQDYGDSAMIWSTCRGRTFSEPVQIISSYMPKEIFGPFVSFAPVGSQWDRPQIKVDLSTDRMHVNGNSMAADPHLSNRRAHVQGPRSRLGPRVSKTSPRRSGIVNTRRKPSKSPRRLCNSRVS
jgi:hypothetical protein